jgi:hypothetical protein
MAMRKFIGVAGFGLLGLLSSTAQAAPCAGFTDVDDTSQFCGNVTWLKNRGITLGCTSATLYCPNDFVSRLQMAAFMNRLGDSLFPLTCAAGQVMKWDGLQWACANDAIGGGGGGGTVTSVAAGTGLTGSPNPITGAGAINIAPGYQLPQACTNGQVPKSNGTGGWVCGTDNAGTGTGTVTSVTATGGGGLATTPGGGISTSGSVGIASGGVQTAMLADSAITNAKIAPGTIAADRLVASQQLPSCVDGQVLRRSGGLWICGSLPPTISTVDSGGSVGGFTGMAIGTDGFPAVSYYDYTNADLKVAKCVNVACTGSATISTVDSAVSVGQSTAMVIGTDGFPVVSYADGTNGDLKVAKCLNAGCTGSATITTVDSGGDVGYSTAIAIGNEGFPVVSYYDLTNGDLKVAKCANAACAGSATITTVDSGGDVGRSTAIAIGTDGFPVVGYYDATNADLKVAKCVNAACTGSATITAVDSAGLVGASTAIVIGADGFPVVSYYDFGNGNGALKVAKCVNAACSGSATITTVDSLGNVGHYTAIAIGTDGFPVVSYYDVTNSDLKVVKCSNAACTGSAARTTVDSVGSVGLYTAIRIGTDGFPVVSYYDATNADLKVLKCSNAACLAP